VRLFDTVVAAATCVLVFGAQTASADPPVRDRIPIDISGVLTGVCEFPVSFHVTGFVVHVDFYDESGTLFRRIEAGPTYRATAVNLETSESFVVHNPGPGLYRFNPDGTATLSTQGPWVFFFNPELGVDSAGYVLARGHGVFEIDAAGNFTDVVEWQGTVVDLCAELAP
jgi:hypothetical protein